MFELSHLASTPRTSDATVRAGSIAERQWGVISRRQLTACGLSSTGTARWAAGGRLCRLHPGVYALGHRGLAAEGWLVAALLYAGPDAILSGRTAAWWWQLTDDRPSVIEVSAPGRRRSLPGVIVHHPRALDRTRHRRLPITTVPRTLLDVAAATTLDRTRRVLAEAEYRGLLDVGAIGAIEAILGRGRPGSAILRAAVEHHRPQLALTRSVLEERFLALCVSARLPLPEINPIVEGLIVDALWRPQRMVVELDGHVAHGSWAQIERDRKRELRLRAAGLLVIRYTWQQITRDAQLVIADLRCNLSRFAPSA